MIAVNRHVFVSYSHRDGAWLERLRVHLRPLTRQAAMDVWDDTRLDPGQTWREEISRAIDRADVAVVLVSADFLASDFVVANELPPLLQRAATRGLLIVPVIVGPCLFVEHDALSRYQSVNTPDRPLTGMSPTDAEATLVTLARSIDQYFRRLDTMTGTARDVLTVARPLNLSFDGEAPDGIPSGWFNSFGHVTGVSTDYGIRLATRSANRSAGSCVVLEKPPPATGEFGSLMQRCPARLVAGHVVRFEGDLKTENVTNWAGLWIRADAEDRPNLVFDNMSRRPVVGTTDWTRFVLETTIPNEADWLNYGIVLAGSGTLYADDLRLRIWTSAGAWTDA